ncbi:Maf-like protein [Sphingomonas changbaiensis NBRC 104936]|uniref:Nucleoside triphosphate pyrophosphatase n=1 Tax=Sphingomonas changbaiensis NBRC 104936 TaxID=1219043 RepID=A0A0E9MRH6_9SPHN|nr:nucleoside triphosphate pyrophosphatase [Sphingomonas changbaiensis]GAO40083.1 Maf-like protein [Sphingomonas changbaiensis NBRC 104936]
MRLILASGSSGRRAMLEAAGVPFEAMAPGVDEESAKASLRAAGLAPRDFADALAELKALKVSNRDPGALVLGCDSVVALEDGTLLDKAESKAQAAEHLRLMSGKRHHLYSAAVIAEAGEPVWRFVDRAAMYVRPLSDAFIDAYLDREWDQARWCVGVYRIEGPGAQLFSRIDGSHFTVIGLPLLPVLDYLRTRGILAS